MRELSANEMEVWLYDVKRNLQVSRLCDVIEGDFLIRSVMVQWLNYSPFSFGEI